MINEPLHVREATAVTGNQIGVYTSGELLLSQHNQDVSDNVSKEEEMSIEERFMKMRNGSIEIKGGQYKIKLPLR